MFYLDEKDGDHLQESVSYLGRHNRLPESLVLLTRTALVPLESFTHSYGDLTPSISPYRTTGGRYRLNDHRIGFGR